MSSSLPRSLPTSSSLRFIANPFTGKTPEELQDFIHSKWQDFVNFPEYNEKKKWHVYLMYKGVFKHYSMLFLLSGFLEGYVVHLLKEDNSVDFALDVVRLRSLRFNHGHHKALFLGTTEEFTAAEIIKKAHDRLVEMDYYVVCLNDCQDYCKKLACDIGFADNFKSFPNRLFAQIFHGVATNNEETQLSHSHRASLLVTSVKDLFETYKANHDDN